MMGVPTASPSQAIAVRGLTKTFGSQRALRGIDLEVKAGESLVIFGPNGAGKTTLIKVLATIMNPSSGSIMIGGLDSRKNAEKVRRRIGVVSHQTFLYSNLTASENLEFYCRMYDVPAVRQRVKEVIAMVGMTSRLHDRVGTLSRGMQQRLSIARSLLHKPDIMLLDEPETGLDQQAIAIFREALQADGEEQCTVVLTSHNLERGLDMGERLLILNRGSIVFQGLTKLLDQAGLKEAYRQYTGVAA
jgi:heme exporter protein A